MSLNLNNPLSTLLLFLILLNHFTWGQSQLPDSLNSLVYDPTKTYEAEDTVISSLDSPNIYTAKIAVPVNTPPENNSSGERENTTYWANESEWTTVLQSENSVAISDVPDDSIVNIDDVTNLGTPTEDTGEDNETVPSGLTSASNKAFVMQQYLDFLGRDGDAEGIAYWTDQLNTNQQTRADCVNNFVFSSEFQLKVAPVSRLYLAYFLRLPDTGGLDYWITQKLNGMELNEISNQFAVVQEFIDRYGAIDDPEFVNLVYSNVLSRSPDSEGLSYWNGQMSAGMSRGEVMTGFSESAEYQQITLNQIRVIAFYYGMLGRAPDQGGFDYWVAKLNNGDQPNELIDGFITSPEYQSRAERSASDGGFGD